MAHVFKPTITRWTGPDGRRCPPNAAGGTKHVTESRKWYAKGVPGWPRGKKVPLATDRRVAQKMLADLVANAERGIAGLPTADLARAPLAGLLAEFEADLLVGLVNKNRSSKKKASPTQAALVCQRVRDVLSGCKFVTVADLNDATPAKVARHLAGRVAVPRKDGGLSPQSADYFRKAVGRFGWWLSVRKNAPLRPDLFEDVPGFDGKREQVHRRRALAPAEVAALLEAARAGGVEYGLTGEDRYFLYLTAFGTGLRASELASLLPAAFRLDADPPTVALAGKYAKNKAANLPLASGVAGQLRSYLDPPGVGILSGRVPRGGPDSPHPTRNSGRPKISRRQNPAAAGGVKGQPNWLYPGLYPNRGRVWTTGDYPGRTRGAGHNVAAMAKP